MGTPFTDKIFRKLETKFPAVGKMVDLKINKWLRPLSDIQNIVKTLKHSDGRIPFDQFEKLMMPDTSNASFNSDVGLNLDIKFAENVFDKLEDFEHKIFDQARKELKDIQGRVLKAFSGNTQALESAFGTFKGTKGISDIANANWTASGSAESLRDQTIAVVENLEGLKAVSSELRFLGAKNLEGFEKSLTAEIGNMGRLIVAKGAELESTVESIDALIKGDFVAGAANIMRSRIKDIDLLLKNPLMKFVSSKYLRAQVSSIPAESGAIGVVATNAMDRIIGIMPSGQVAGKLGLVSEERISSLDKDKTKKFALELKAIRELNIQELIKLGYIKPGFNTFIDQAWTGKDDVKKRADLTDEIYAKAVELFYKQLLKQQILKTTDPVEHVKSVIKALYEKGIDAAKAIEPAKVTAKEANENMTAAPVSDAIPFSIPTSSAAPIYPYNNVRKTEGGHVQELDNTPGNERVSERHRVGTGYEIDKDGNMTIAIRGNRYTAIVGSDRIIVKGDCQIFVEGDASIVADNARVEAANDLELSAGATMKLSCADLIVEVDGTKVENIGGDSAISVAGFFQQATAGDYQIDAGSFSAVAKGGSMNLVSSSGIGIVSDGSISVQSSGDLGITAAGSGTIHAGGAMAMTAEGGLLTHGDGGNAVSSGGTTSIAGAGTIQLSHPVEKALFADTAGIAPDGPAIPVSPSGSSSGSTSGQGEAVSSKTSEFVEKFTVSDFDASQSKSGDGSGPTTDTAAI